MTIKKVVIQNFKGIESGEFNLEGKSVYLIGKNAAGKTSLADSIFKSLGTIETKKGFAVDKVTNPVMNGKESAQVINHIENEHGKYIVTTEYFPDGKRKFLIESPDGFNSSKVATLNRLVGDVSFDVGEFIALGNTVPGKREQVEILKRFIPDEKLKEILKNEETIETKTETRQSINRKIAELKMLVKQSYSDTDKVKYADKKDAVILSEEISNAKDHNKLQEGLLSVIENEKGTLNNHRRIMKQYKDAEKGTKDFQIDIHSIRLNSVEKLVKDLQSKYDSFKPIDTVSKEQELIELNDFNKKVDDINKWKSNKLELGLKEDAYKAEGESINTLRAKNKLIVSESELPIKNVELSEDSIMINGVDIDALSTAEKLNLIAIPMAIAKNPSLKIIRVSHGESLDYETLKEVNEKANKSGYQLIIEEVDRRTDKLKIEFVDKD